MATLRPRLEQSPLEQIIADEIPDPERAFRGLGIEPNEFTDPESPIALEFVRPDRCARICVADDLDGNLRHAAFPHLPRVEVLVLVSESHERIGREANARIRWI